MAVGRLAWHTPTGAQLWEIWGRHKWSLALQGLAFLACLGFVRWKAAFPSEISGAVLSLASYAGFVMAYLQLLMCFGYVEADARTVKVGFPGRLLLKPVSTARLVTVPMTCGGLITLVVFLAWANWILQPLGVFGGMDVLWIGLVQLSFFWWLQALGWSLPPMPGRSLILLVAGLGHLLPGLMPQMFPELGAGWRWSVLVILWLGAWIVANCGMALMRRGTWENPSGFTKLLKRFRAAKSSTRTRRFRSAFRAQFWLEWQRQGMLLPGLSCWIAIVIFPLIFMIQKHLGDRGSAGGPEPSVTPAIALVLPLLLSGAVAPAMAKFDPLQPSDELPVYIAVRPMTNGVFVVVKLAMALVASALTCVMTSAIAVFWIVVLDGASVAKAAKAIPYGPVVFLIGCVPLLLFLILFTWTNMIAGIGVGLTGRPWVTKLSGFLRMALMGGLVALAFAAKLDADLQETLLRWLPTALVVALTLKLAMSTAAFFHGMRRNAITGGAIGWIVGAWALGGVFIAMYAALICHALGSEGTWPMIVLTGFLMLPLADLAIAPLAMAWNRHR